MFSKPFPCGARLPRGRRCDALAQVIDVEQTHRAEFDEDRFSLVTDEVEFTLECPRCGQWKRVETVHRTETFR
jgi:hypothetical protein